MSMQTCYEYSNQSSLVAVGVSKNNMVVSQDAIWRVMENFVEMLKYQVCMLGINGTVKRGQSSKFSNSVPVASA